MSPDFPKPSVTVDVALFAIATTGAEVLLIERARDPFAGRWALPGGFLDMDEELETAARRELEEETALSIEWLRPFGTFGKVDRDPRGRTITVAYYSVVDKARLRPAAGDDAAATDWFDIAQPPKMAFDHDDVLATAIDAMRRDLIHDELSRHLVSGRFELAELRAKCEVVLGRRVNPQTLRSALLRSKAVRCIDRDRRVTLYQFGRRRFSGLCGLAS